MISRLKKCAIVATVVAVLTVLLCISASAATTYTEGDYTYTVSDGKATITDVNTSISGAVTIPATLGGYPVTTIGGSAFWGCSNLTSVTIGNSVTSIGDHAFYNCSLKSITIPDSVTSIGSYAFLNCSSLTSVTIPDGVTTISSYAFDSCSGLTSITIPDSVTSIGNYAFSGCSSLTSITIPDSVTSIGNGAFSGCSNLTGVTIPDSVTSIGNSAFEGCSSLTSITIPDSVTSIGSRAFARCSNLTSITVAEENIKYVSVNDVLYTKDGMTLVCYPAGKVDTSFVILNSVTTIGNGAFLGCSGLTSITIPDSVVTIGDYAFSGCKSLTSVTIPDSVTSIGNYAFYGCSNLTSITVDDGNTAYKDIDGVLFTADGTTLIQYPAKKSGMSYTIPDSVTTIGDFAFYYCNSLTSVTIPDSVTSIGGRAFEYCSSLTICAETMSQPTGWDTNWNPGNRPVVWGYVVTTGISLDKTSVTLDTFGGTIQLIATVMPNNTPDESVTWTSSNPAVATVDASGLVTAVGNGTTIITASTVDGRFYATCKITTINLSSAGTYIVIANDTFTVVPKGSIEVGSGISTMGADGVLYERYTYTTDGSDVASSGHILVVSKQNIAAYIAGTVKAIELEYDDVNGELVGQEVYIKPDDDGTVNIAATGNSVAGKLEISKDRSGRYSVKVGDKVYVDSKASGNLISADIDFAVLKMNIRNSVVYSSHNATRTSVLSNQGMYDLGLILNKGGEYNLADIETFYNDYTNTQRELQSYYAYDFDGDGEIDRIVVTEGYIGYINSSNTAIDGIEGVNIRHYNTNGVCNHGVCATTTYKSNSYTINNGGVANAVVMVFGDFKTKKVEIQVLEANIKKLVEIDYDDNTFKFADGSVYSYASSSITEAYVWAPSLDVATRPVSASNPERRDNESMTKSDWEELIGKYVRFWTDGQYFVRVDEDPYDCVMATGVSFDKTSATLDTIGETLQITATVTPDHAYDKSVTWTSSNTAVATVDSNGLVTAIANGTCTITATTTDGGFTATCQIIVDTNLKYYTYSVSDGMATITDVDTSILGDITIPSTLGGYPVTSIGRYAFEDCSSLKSIIIPDSVTTIGNYAFRNCSSLTSVTIPDSVTTIDSYVFEDCSSLTSITIPDSVTSIGSDAFSGCSSLESMVLPFVGGSVKSASDRYQYPFGYIFGTSSYTGGVATTQYYYGSSTSSTTYNTYYIPSSLKSVTITGGNILYGAFYNCSSITSITIPDSVTSIGGSAFRNCSSLTSVTIPDGVTSIGSMSFYGCNSLTSVIIPDSVTSIDSYAFCYCSSLTSITIPDSVTSIGEDIFGGCNSLTSVTIGDSVTTIGDYAFFGCSSLTSVVIGDSVTSIGDYAFYYCSSLTSITIPDSVTSIGKYAFENCSSLASVTIGNSVTSIGGSAFEDCSSLTSINISDIAAWCGISFGNYCAHPLYYANNLYLNGELVTNLVIPNSVTSIGDYAFQNCTSLKSITIPDSVTSIGSYAFYYCTSLTSVTIPDSVTSIGNEAFQFCFDLTNVIIGNGVTSIGDYAFFSCGKLTDITIGNSVTSIGHGALHSCKMNSVVIPASVKNIEGYALANCDSLISVVIPNSVVSIGERAFWTCESLKTVVIPDSVTSIGNEAFAECNMLTINCEPTSQPVGWNTNWNPDNRPVVWGYNNPSVGETITGYSLTLQGNNGGDIGVNLKMLLSDQLLVDEGAYVKVTINGVESRVSLDSLIYDEKTGKYTLKTVVAVKNIIDDITVTMYNGAGECGANYTYSVKNYAEYILEHSSEYDAKLVSMVKATLNYGAMAQKYFCYNTENLANASLSQADKAAIDAVTSIDVADATYTENAESAGVAKHSVSIVLDSETTIKHYITPAEGQNISNYIFTIGGSPVTPVLDGDRYCIRITDIAAADLDGTFTLQVINTNPFGMYTATYNVMNYVEAMFNACKDNPAYTDLCNLLKAIYLYNDAANTYFGK